MERGALFGVRSNRRSQDHQFKLALIGPSLKSRESGNAIRFQSESLESAILHFACIFDFSVILSVSRINTSIVS